MRNEYGIKTHVFLEFLILTLSGINHFMSQRNIVWNHNSPFIGPRLL